MRIFGMILVPLGVLQGAWGMFRVATEGVIWQTVVVLLLGLVWIVQGSIFFRDGRRRERAQSVEQPRR